MDQNKKNEIETKDGLAPFNDFQQVLKTHSVDGLFYIRLPVEWEPFESDRFRAKSKNDQTQISITNWNLNTKGQILNAEEINQQLTKLVLPQYEDFVANGGYEPHDDLIINEKDGFISKSFKVDAETQYYLTTLRSISENKTILTMFIIRDIGEYNPEMRARLLIIRSMMQYV